MLDSLKRKVKIDTPEGPKIATMVEGAGIYTCHTHHFETTDLAKYNIHLKGEGHLLIGSESSCVMCNKEHVSMDGVNAGANAVCDECTMKLAEQAKQAQRRLAEMKKR